MARINQSSYGYKGNQQILQILIYCRITLFTLPPDLFTLKNEKDTGLAY